MNTRFSQPPIAETVCEVLHGTEVEDPFRWLEDQESPATRSFIKAENRTFREYLNRHKKLRCRIERRVTELLTVASVDLPVPDHRGGLVYLKREAEQEQKAIYYRDEANVERLLISVAMLGRDSYSSLAILQVSPGGRYLLTGVRTGGEDFQEICIYDLTESKLLTDRLPRGLYRGVVFDGASSGFYYVHEEATGKYLNRRAVRYHQLGSHPQNDTEIFHAGEGPTTRLIVHGAEDASALCYLIISLESVPQTRFLIHKFPLSTPPQEIIRLSGASFGPRFCAGTIEASTTHGAPLGRIVRIALEHPEPQAWSDLIPEAAERLHSWERCGELRVIHYTAGSRQMTQIHSDSGRLIRTISYPALGTTLLGKVDVHAHRLFYSHSDINKSPAIYAVDLNTGEHSTWWLKPDLIPLAGLEIEDCSYQSRDGTAIPMTLIRPRGALGRRPVLLTAYGGGGACATPKFSALLTILAESGFTCAIAHVRGGGEEGLEWHLAAQKQRKQTSVDDLITASKWLIENEYTTRNQLGLAGHSAGALLVLCAITQQPDSFRAAMAIGPIADLTRFHLFGVARGFVAELGSPDVPDEFYALHRLSPYHAIRCGVRYPAVLVISGDRDKRCDSLHARKIIARLKSTTSQCAPILLDYAEFRGHKPVLPLRERIRALTNRLTFLIAELDIDPAEVHRS